MILTPVLNWLLQCAGAGVPHSCGVIPGFRDDLLAIRRECDRGDQVCVTG
jgi:hypothetical protein